MKATRSRTTVGMGALCAASMMAAASCGKEAGSTPHERRGREHGTLPIAESTVATVGSDADVSSGGDDRDPAATPTVANASEISSLGSPTPTPSAAPTQAQGPVVAGTMAAGNGATGTPNGTPLPQGTPTATSFFGESRCTASGALLCEDFESGVLNSNRWQVRGDNVRIVDTKAARGKKALQITTQGNAWGTITNKSIFPVPNNTFYGRMFVQFSGMPKAPQWAHWTLVEAIGTGAAGMFRPVGGQYDGKTNRYGSGSDGGPTGDWTNLDKDPGGSPRDVPLGTWMCLEWLSKGDTHESRFWWDEVEHPSLYTSKDKHGGNQVPYLHPQFTQVWIGWALYQGNPQPSQFDMWIDEVVFSKERVGCRN